MSAGTTQNRALFTVAEAADYLGVHHQTIRRHITNGKLRATRPGGWAIRVHRTDLEKFADAPHEASA